MALHLHHTEKHMNNVTCLLIDNDEEDQEIFSMAMHDVNSNMLCVFAVNGVAAMKLLNSDVSFVPSIIFMDINMPLMDGADCLREIKKIERLQQIPVYIYSTTADPQSLARVKQLGSHEVIIKPTTFTNLKETLARLLASHNAL